MELGSAMVLTAVTPSNCLFFSSILYGEIYLTAR